MKLWSGFFVICVALMASCNNEKLCDEADIILSFKVYRLNGTNRVYYDGVIGDDHTVTIKLSPQVNAEDVLNNVYPVFYLSKGATVTPDASLPQNFAQAGGVQYTVTSENGKRKNVYTVTNGRADPIPYGEGFGFTEKGQSKTFPELGYPGVVGGENWTLPSIQYGDLLVYHAYCGDQIVLISREYIDTDPTSPHCVKVINKTTLEPSGNLNLGGITLANMKMITSDYKGHCVAAVTSGSETEFFYWTTPSAAPVSVGKIGINMAPAPANAQGCNNFQVAGDITGNAWITARAPSTARGEHYRVKVTGGRLAVNYSIVESGHSSSDNSWFQMISPLDDSDNPSYVVGDTEGPTASTVPINTNKCYINSSIGAQVFIMPELWSTTLGLSAGVGSWYVGTGMATNRQGGRSPVVSALPINGKTYITVALGSNFYHAAAVLNDNLQTLANNNRILDITSATISRGWSYGAWVDWYYDDELKEAYLAVWFGRVGLQTFKLTCFL